MEDHNAGVHKYTRMRLSKLSLDEFEFISKISRSTLSLWYNCQRGATIKQVDTMAYHLKCDFDVILGRKPCLAKCPHCEQSQR